MGLTRTLRSLLPCRLDLEVQFIFVDGASTDGSAEIAKQFYTDSEFSSEPDDGIYDAMNRGLARSTGKYVLWLNSGDEIISDHLADVKAKLRECDAAIVVYGVKLSSEDNPEEQTLYMPSIRDLPAKTLPHQSTFFLRQNVNELGGYSTRFKIVADRELILRMYFLRKKIDVEPKPISVYYTGGVSSTVDASIENTRVDFIFHLCGFRQAIRRAVQLKGRAVLPRFTLSLMLDFIMRLNLRSLGGAN